MITLFGSIGWAIAAAIIMFLACIASEIEEDGITAYVAGSVMFLLFTFWGVPCPVLVIEIKHIVAYLIIGFIYSVVRAVTWETNEKRYNKAKDHAWRWIILWPTSLLYFILGDVAALFAKLVGKFYDRLQDLGKNIEE